MKAFKTHSGIVAPILLDNVDTDQIIPSRDMKRVSKLGLGDGLFAGWRYTYDGIEKTGLTEDFVLNKPAFSGASIVLGGQNWGCGSSREHAVWALSDFGIRVVIAESFGRIFHRNCARNGVLAIELDGDAIHAIAEQTNVDPQAAQLHIDLTSNQIKTPDGTIFSFSVDESDRYMLLNGLDYIESTMQHNDAIATFISTDQSARAWAHLKAR